MSEREPTLATDDAFQLKIGYLFIVAAFVYQLIYILAWARI